MSEGWEQKTLGEVVHFSGGGTPSKKVDQYWNGDIPWVSPKDMKSRLISTSIDMITEEGISKSSAKLIPAGSVLIVIRSGILSRTVPIGITTKELAVNQDLKALVPNHGIITTEYLYNFLASAEQQILDLVTRGATVHRLSMDHLKSIPISIPSLSEQKRIVAILDEAFGAIARAKENAEQNLANARELFDSYLNRVFTEKGEGWVEKRLNDVCEVIRGSSPRPIKQYLTESEDGVNWVKIADATKSGKYIKKTNQKITPKGAERSRKVSPGDLLLSNSMSYGQAYIMAIDGYVHDGWFVLRDFSDTFELEFLYTVLTSRIVQEQFGILAAGAVVKNISSDLVKRAILPVPPKEEQVSLVSQISELEKRVSKLESLIQQKITALDELKQSLLQKAFTGQLTSKTKELELVP